MNNENLIKEIQQSVEQMKTDDIEENPEAAYEEFECDCCGVMKILAGSMVYKNYRLCNDCVLLAEASFSLKKIKEIEELLKSMEDKRFENTYNAIFNKDDISNN